MMVDGIRMDHIARCICGRRPVVMTCYKGGTPGEGPFIIRCHCGHSEDDIDPRNKLPRLRFCRSWYKTRAVQRWRGMNKRAREESLA